MHLVGLPIESFYALSACPIEQCFHLMRLADSSLSLDQHHLCAMRNDFCIDGE